VIDTKTAKVLGEWVRYGTLGGLVMNTGAIFGTHETRCHFSNETPDNSLVEEKALTNTTGKILTHYSKSLVIYF